MVIMSVRSNNGKAVNLVTDFYAIYIFFFKAKSPSSLTDHKTHWHNSVFFLGEVKDCLVNVNHI